MTGQCRLDGDLRCFQIANFTDHDDVGILAQERAQCRSEVKTDLIPDLDLINAHQIVFYRILSRRNVNVWFIELRESGVERGRLAAAGRASNKNHAVWLMNRVLKIL